MTTNERGVNFQCVDIKESHDKKDHCFVIDGKVVFKKKEKTLGDW